MNNGTQAAVVFLNAFAGFYAAFIWLYFGWLRIRSRQWIWASLNVGMVACALVVGVAYYILATDPTRASPWFELLRLLVVPILVIPTILHLAIWRQARAFLSRVEGGDSERH